MGRGDPEWTPGMFPNRRSCAYRLVLWTLIGLCFATIVLALAAGLFGLWWCCEWLWEHRP